MPHKLMYYYYFYKFDTDLLVSSSIDKKSLQILKKLQNN